MTTPYTYLTDLSGKAVTLSVNLFGFKMEKQGYFYVRPTLDLCWFEWDDMGLTESIKFRPGQVISVDDETMTVSVGTV